MTLPEWCRFLSGPLPEHLCWFHTVVKNGVMAKVLYLQTSLIVVRYALIFWLKNPFAFKDDFWRCFINRWCNLFSIWPHFAFTFFPGRHPIGYYICTGHDPAEDSDKPIKFNYIHFVVGYSSLALHIIMSIRIFFYKNKVIPVERTTAPSHRDATSSEKNSLSGFTTLTGGLALTVALGIIFIKYSSMEPKNYNRFPDYLIVYWIQLVNAPLTILIVLLLSFARNELMRTVMLRETKELLSGVEDSLRESLRSQ